jgi:uncharacterized protein (DUF433 family)
LSNAPYNAKGLPEDIAVVVSHDQALLSRHVALERVVDPAEARLRESGVPVWALVGYWRSAGEDVGRTAKAYHVPRQAVEAALVYYRDHSPEIDARLAANAAA